MNRDEARLHEARERNRARLARTEFLSFIEQNAPAEQVSFVAADAVGLQPQLVWRRAQALTRAAAASEIFVREYSFLTSREVREWLISQISAAVGSHECVLWSRQFETDAWLRVCVESPVAWIYLLWSKLAYRDLMIKAKSDEVVVIKEKEYYLYSVRLAQDEIGRINVR